MFESQESEPWYKSLSGLIAASVLIPPLGLAMLWTRRDVATSRKILGSNSVGEPVYASPAIADGRIYIRGEKNLYAIGN